MVRPWKDPWGLSPSLGPTEAWAVLTALCGSSRPVGPPRSSRDAYVGRVCHRHCGGDRHPVRLVCIDGSFGCRTMAAKTRDLMLDTLPSFTGIYRVYFSIFEDFHHVLGNFYRLCGIPESCGHPDPNMCPRREFSPWRLSRVPAAMLGRDRAPPWFALKRGVKQYPGPHGPYGECLTLPITHGYSSSRLWEFVFSGALGTGMGPIPSLTFPIGQIELEFLKFQFDDRILREID